jgi:hypothetical protein
VLILHFWAAPRRQDALAVPPIALALAWLDHRWVAQPWQPLAAASFLGLASLTVLGLRAIWQRENPGPLRRVFWAAALFPALAWTAGYIVKISIPLRPTTWDLALYSFDCSLGLQISFAVGRWLQSWSWLGWLCDWVYQALPLAMILVFASHLKREDTRSQARLALAFALAGPVGWLFYNILPGMGPGFIFPSFPDIMFPTALVKRLVIAPIPVQGPRNAIPSMHLAWILLAWWNSRTCPAWLRAAVAGFLILTVPATLGSGQHYVVDLVVAVPFAVAVQALASLWPGPGTAAARWALLAALAGTLAWLALIRFGTQLMWRWPALPWILCLETVAGYLALERKMAASLSVRQASLDALS